MAGKDLMAQWTFEGDTSVTWQQAIERYAYLDSLHTGAKLTTIGHDDDGHPIHLFIISDGSGFTPDSIRATGKNILWVTNGIHPGEPDGIDASLILAQALLESDQLMGLLVNTAVCIVPVYNVSGALNRGSFSRANQDGPKEYGFRGNAKNLDLNRDFMKMDSENARSLVAALTAWDPDIYFETHVSDGADHQYIMALLATQKDKLSKPLADFMTVTLIPGQYAWMQHKGMLMCPYFETTGSIPEEGLQGFNDGPRYSSGHAALFNRIGIISESHMLKPYPDRVNATLQLLFGTLAVMNEHNVQLREARAAANSATARAGEFGLNWRLDTAVVEDLPWKGFAVKRETSAVTGLPRIRYDHAEPTDILVPWRDAYRPSLTVRKPKAYIVPRQWQAVVERLRLNGVQMEPLAKDTVLTVEQDSIGDFITVSMAYEGHYLHRNIHMVRNRRQVAAHAGDWRIPMGNLTDRYVVEALESQADDGFFAWNFFDALLQQKEWFDDYVFEDLAARMLAGDPSLAGEFKTKRASDASFAADAQAQLTWLYRRSPWMEPGYRKYPVLREVE
ncbi:MAG: hypothetical protein JST38_16805 [Bacteroidetes bacterium]|nr:hypothetical protein [Bacteroidota bacterium]MBS1942531.1 hypothetical protein [Bacteroidota bacterium]